MRKWVATLMCIVMLCGVLAGCGGKQNMAVNMEDPNTVPEDSYEINWYMAGPTLRDVTSVENAINAYLKDKINATVKIHRLENAQYSEKLSNMIQVGEYFDICFATNWMLNYEVNAENGAFVALDDLFNTYLPKSYEMLDPTVLDCVKVNDKVYALPVIKESVDCLGWVYRKDLADKYNIDMSKIKSYDELEPVALMIKENEPDIKYPIDWAVDTCPSALSDMSIIQGVNLGYVRGDDSFTIVNRLERPEMIKEFEKARRFYKEGLIKEDILTNSSDYIQRLKNGQAFCALMGVKPGKVEEILPNANYEFAQVYVEEPTRPINAGISSMNAISATSKNPARVARFLELLNTDEYLSNLVIFGIEGKHYEKLSDNMVRQIPDSGYSLAESRWMLGNAFQGYLVEGDDPEKNEKLKEFDKNAKPNPLSGFRFVTESVQAEIAACAAVEIQYNNQVTLGAMEPGPVVEKYLADLKAAGIDTIKEELQRQVTEYMAKQK